MPIEKLYGLIGYPLSHSFSKGYFSAKFENEKIPNIRYENFPLEDISEFGELLKSHPSLCGLNVTIPHKESVLQYLDECSPDALSIGAVNTIKILKSGNTTILKGYNTDTHGFAQTLDNYGVIVPSKSLVLGTGGASKAVEWVLKARNSGVVFVSRNPDGPNSISYEELKYRSLKEFNLIVNSTPLGMHPNSSEYPDIPYHTAGPEHVFIDLIYNPSETIFMKNAFAVGAKAFNGLLMLEQQAEKAWSIWNSNSL